MNKENGAQRAQRRAAARGLAVGAPVRVYHPDGVPGLHFGMQQAAMVPKRVERFGGKPRVVFPRPTSQHELVPLERIDRMARYLLQRDVTTHVRHGSRWQPTPRQRRRLDKKARRISPQPYPVTPESERLAASWQRAEPVRELIEAGHVIHPDSPAAPVTPEAFMAWDEPARLGVTPHVMSENPPQRERSAINRNGYRVVDRRGEHRS
jgi:hypothetical protein